jgi:polysaccharide biosynthesis/export protein
MQYAPVLQKPRRAKKNKLSPRLRGPARDNMFPSAIHHNKTKKTGSKNMKKHVMTISSILLALLFIGTAAHAGDPKNKPQEYQIGIGDILEIVTWKEPDFSREEITVRLDGKISFPLLDDIQAANQSPTQLKKSIESKLTEYVSSPSVTVTVINAASQRFYILGEVVNTGEYPLAKELTVLQAFALAGGFTEWASKKEIILYRKENGKDKVIRINYKGLIKNKDFSQNVPIKSNDTIIVP